MDDKPCEQSGSFAVLWLYTIFMAYHKFLQLFLCMTALLLSHTFSNFIYTFSVSSSWNQYKRKEKWAQEDKSYCFRILKLPFFFKGGGDRTWSRQPTAPSSLALTIFSPPLFPLLPSHSSLPYFLSLPQSVQWIPSQLWALFLRITDHLGTMALGFQNSVPRGDC